VLKQELTTLLTGVSKLEALAMVLLLIAAVALYAAQPAVL
jgi:hypothetical protein